MVPVCRLRNCFACTCLTDSETKTYEIALDLTVHLACNIRVEIELGWFFISCFDSYIKEPILGSQHITVWITAEDLNLGVCYSSQVRSLGFVIDGQLLTFFFYFMWELKIQEDFVFLTEVDRHLDFF